MPEERRRVDLVVERLNTEFRGRVRLETVRWETSYYSAHDTFQKQIPEAANCDLVFAIFRARLGTPLPASFPTLPSGEPYPSGTAYEVLSAIEVRRGGQRVPDVYVFRYPHAPAVALDAPDRAEIEAQWGRLKGFFDRWFRTTGGEFVAAFQDYASTDDFAKRVEECLRQWLATRGILAQGPLWDRVLHGSPFPGLAAFGAERGRVFFGRDLAIARVVERLQEIEAAGETRLPFLLILGASGSGKSSLLRAGLLPRLTLPGTIPTIDLWRVAIVAPGPDPFLSLAEALFAEAALGPELRQGTFRTRELLAKQLAGDPDLAAAPLRDALAPRPRRGASRRISTRPGRPGWRSRSTRPNGCSPRPTRPAPRRSRRSSRRSCGRASRPSSWRCAATPMRASRATRRWWGCGPRAQPSIYCRRTRPSSKRWCRARSRPAIRRSPSRRATAARSRLASSRTPGAATRCRSCR